MGAASHKAAVAPLVPGGAELLLGLAALRRPTQGQRQDASAVALRANLFGSSSPLKYFYSGSSRATKALNELMVDSG